MSVVIYCSRSLPAWPIDVGECVMVDRYTSGRFQRVSKDSPYWALADGNRAVNNRQWATAPADRNTNLDGIGSLGAANTTSGPNTPIIPQRQRGGMPVATPAVPQRNESQTKTYLNANLGALRMGKVDGNAAVGRSKVPRRKRSRCVKMLPCMASYDCLCHS